MNGTYVALTIYLLDNHTVLSPSLQRLLKLPPEKKENIEKLTL